MLHILKSKDFEPDGSGLVRPLVIYLYCVIKLPRIILINHGA
jgi:hypothetical protein